MRSAPHHHGLFFVLKAIAFFEKKGYNIVKDIYQKGSINMTVTKDSVIGDILDANADLATYFFEIGMHCLGCPHSRAETIEQACSAHGTDADELIEKLNAALGN